MNQKEIATLTKEQAVLIGVAVDNYCRKLNKLADDLDNIGKFKDALETKNDVVLLRDAYWKLTWYREWKVKE